MNVSHSVESRRICHEIRYVRVLRTNCCDGPTIVFGLWFRRIYDTAVTDLKENASVIPKYTPEQRRCEVAKLTSDSLSFCAHALLGVRDQIQPEVPIKAIQRATLVKVCRNLLN